MINEGTLFRKRGGKDLYTLLGWGPDIHQIRARAFLGHWSEKHRCVLVHEVGTTDLDQLYEEVT